MSKLLMPLASMLLIRSLDTESPTVQVASRIAFAVVHAVLILFIFYLRMKITNSDDKKIINVPGQKVPFGEPQPDRKLTVAEYDLEQFNETIMKRIMMGVGIVAFISYQWGHVVPLVMQCLMNPFSVYSSPLVSVYIFGKAATGDLARPWAQQNPLGFLSGPETSTAATTTADKKKN